MLTTSQQKLKRILLRAFDVLTWTIIALALMPMWAQPAYAYVDPSVMTYTIQAVAGVAVALSAVAGVALRRTRKFLFKVFKIDENANKVVDPDVQCVDEQDLSAMQMLDEAARTAALESKTGKPAPRLKWKNRIWRALVVCFFVAFTFIFVAPCELVIGNSADLTYDISYIAPVLAVATLIVTLVVSVIISFAPGRAFDVILALMAALGICLWAQGVFLNAGLPSANGAAITWSDYAVMNILSLIIWIAIFVGCIVLSLIRVKGMRVANILCAAALILVQGIGLVSLVISPADSSDVSGNSNNSYGELTALNASKISLTEKGLYDVSSKSNVIMFVLDCEDTAEWEEVRQEYPDLLSEMTGFTYFKNITAATYPTRNGIAYLLTHEWPSHTETWTEYANTRYQRASLLPDMSTLGYSLGFYSTDIENTGLISVYQAGAINVAYNGELVNQTQAEEAVSKADAFKPLGALAILLKTSCYRDLPWLAKPDFRYYTDSINNAMTDTAAIERAVAESNAADPYANVEYATNDAEYYKALTGYKLRINDENSGENGSFRFIHLFGSHAPYTMDENGQDHSSEESIDGEGDKVEKSQQIRGSIRIVSEYIQQLKELGVYDNTTIIITSDHPRLCVNTLPLQEAECPILLVKPAQSAELDAAPVITNTMPVSQTDIAATMVQAMGGDYSKYGQTAFEINNADRVRYFEWVGTTATSWWGAREYVITGDALDWNNWALTGYYWDLEQYMKSGVDVGKDLDDIEWEMPGVEHPILCGSDESKALEAEANPAS